MQVGQSGFSLLPGYTDADVNDVHVVSLKLADGSAAPAFLSVNAGET